MNTPMLDIQTAFLDQLEKLGSDRVMLEEFLRESDKCFGYINDFVKEAEVRSGEKDFRLKTAAVLLDAMGQGGMLKTADLRTALLPLMQYAGQLVGRGTGAGGSILGAGGGGLISLLLNYILGWNHPVASMLLGSLLGGGAGNYLGHGQAYNLLNNAYSKYNQPTQPSAAQVIPSTLPQLKPIERELQNINKPFELKPGIEVNNPDLRRNMIENQAVQHALSVSRAARENEENAAAERIRATPPSPLLSPTNPESEWNSNAQKSINSLFNPIPGLFKS